MLPRVSIVINTLDRARSLRRTLRSLTQLDYPSFEIVVVCGPIRDETEAVLEEFAGRIRVGRCATANLSESRNIGIAMAAGDCVAFIDDDAYPDPAWLNELVGRLEDWEVAAVGGPVYDASGVIYQTRALLVDRFGNWKALPRDHGRLFSYPGSLWAPYAMGTNSLYRRATLIEVGGFDEEIEYHIDEAEVCRRLVDRGYVVSYAENAYVHHKVLANRLRTEERNWNSRFAIIKNTCYYALRHGVGTTSFADVCRELIDYVETHRADVDAAIEAKRLTPDARALLEQDIASGFDTAVERAMRHAPRLRSRRWFEALRGRFLPFPTLRPAEQKLHVCLLTDEYLPAQLNGIARTVHTLASGLAERGHVVRVLCDGPEPGQVDLIEGVWVHRVPIRHHEPPRGFPMPDLIHYSMSMVDEIRRLDKLRPVDVVQAPNWGAAAFAIMGARDFKTVLSLHTPLKTVAAMDHRVQGRGERAREARRLIEVESRIYPLPNMYIASTPAIVEEIEGQYRLTLDRSKVAVVNHGLPDHAPELRPTTHDDSVEVLFVGRLEPRKGIDTLLACIPELCERHPDLRFTIVGNDQIRDPSGVTYRQRFESGAGRGLMDRVCFTGLIDHDELMRRYAACDVFVAPSRYESFGLILLEAMMFGKPVIASAAGGMKQIIEPDGNGLLAQPGDPAALARAIATLVASRELRERFGRRSRELYEQRYSGARMAAETNAVYDRLLGRSTADWKPGEDEASPPGVGVAPEPLPPAAADPQDGREDDNGNHRGGRNVLLTTLLRRGKAPVELEPPAPTEPGGVWVAQDVLGGVDPAVHTVRTYIEQQDLRKALALAAAELTIKDACDVGAGYGRMSLVLGDQAEHVVAFEREASLVEVGTRLLPSVEWRQVQGLDKLAAEPASFDLALTFTVLQHMTDEFAARVLADIRRVVRRPGLVLLCEESDPEHRWGPVGDTSQIFTIGRSVAQYALLMEPFELVHAFERRMEPGYPREKVGHYMIFKAK